MKDDGGASTTSEEAPNDAGARHQETATDADTHTADLLGTWTYTGYVVGSVTLELTFNPDGTFAFSQQLLPFNQPSGPSTIPKGCVTSHFYHGSYSSTVVDGSNMLKWLFDHGVANNVAGCDDGDRHLLGTPMSPEVVNMYIEQGVLPPSTVIYRVNSDMLKLSLPGPNDNKFGIGHASGTTFVKSR